MGIEQILRIARLTALALLAGGSLPAFAQPARAAVPDEPVAIVDLRPDTEADPEAEPEPGSGQSRAESRQAFAGELDSHPGIALVSDAVLTNALAGELAASGTTLPGQDGVPGTPGPGDSAADLASAARAHDRKDCTAAVPPSERAVLAAAARQAAGDRTPAVIADLRRAYTYLFLCAHDQSRTEDAMRVKGRLERLGIDRPPPEVDILVWNLYPALDVTTNAYVIELTVTTEPAGGAVWLDHQLIGTAPVTALVSEGGYLLAAASAQGRMAREISVARGPGYDGDRVALTVTIPAIPVVPVARAPRATRDVSAVAATIAGWRAGGIVPGPSDMGKLLSDLELRMAVVLGKDARVTVWALGPGETEARRLGSYRMRDAAVMASTIVQRVRRWELTGPDSTTPLLREDRAPRTTSSGQKTGQKTWIYVAVLGAVAAGVGVILFQQFADDRQRIELRFP